MTSLRLWDLTQTSVWNTDILFRFPLSTSSQILLLLLIIYGFSPQECSVNNDDGLTLLFNELCALKEYEYTHLCRQQ